MKTPLTKELLTSILFGHNESGIENVKLPYFCKDGVCLFYNGSPPENTYLIGHGFSVFETQKYYASEIRWISTLEELKKIYTILTLKKL